MPGADSNAARQLLRARRTLRFKKDRFAVRRSHGNTNRGATNEQLGQIEHLARFVADFALFAAPSRRVDRADLRHDVARERTRERPTVRVQDRPHAIARSSARNSSSPARPAPLAAWYVATRTDRNPATSRIGRRAVQSTIAVQFATGKRRCSARSTSPFTSGTISGTPSPHAKGGAVVDDDRTPSSTRAGAYRSLASSPPAKNTTSKPRSASSDAARTSSEIAAKHNGAVARARSERPQLADGKIALFEQAQDRFADGTRRADDGDVHALTSSFDRLRMTSAAGSSRIESSPIERPAPVHDGANGGEHPGYERFARQGIVTYREQFAGAAEEHLVMREQSRKPNAVNCRRLCR